MNSLPPKPPSETSESHSPETSHHSATPFLALLAAIAAIAVLKWSQSVTLPLAFAFFVIALAWPLQNKLAEKMPNKAAFGVTMLAVVAIFLLFCGGLYFCAAVVVERAPEYSQEAQQMYSRLQQFGETYGVRVPPPGELQDSLGGHSRLDTVAPALRFLLSLAGTLVLTFAFFGLGLADTRRIRETLRKEDNGESSRLLDSLHKMTEKFQRYFVVRTVISAIQGIVTFAFALLVGLDFAVLWGVMSALLNFIPTLGSLVAVIPPTLWALFQFQSPGMAALVFFGNCVIQLALGAVVDPLLEGKQLQLSPLVVLFSIAFWGWVWGIGGALIGVPITVAIVIMCHEFNQLKWLADLMTTTEVKPETEAAQTKTSGL